MRICMLDPFRVAPDYTDELLCALRANMCIDYCTAESEYAMRLSHPDDRVMFCRLTRNARRTALGQYLRAGLRCVQFLEYQSDKVRFLRYLKNTPNILIHIQWWLFPALDTGWLESIASRSSGLVYTAHNLVPHDERTATISPALRRFYNKMDRIIVHSEALKSELALLVPEASTRIRVVPHGLMWSAETPIDRAVARRQLGWKQKECVFLAMGNVFSYKGLDVLVDALAMVGGTRPIRLVIAGKWEVSSQEVKMIVTPRARYHLEVHSGFVARRDLVTMLCGCDSVVLPYKRASQSGVGLAALRFGTPIIATKTGGLEELVGDHGQSFLCSPGDAESLRQALERFIDLDTHEVAEWRSELMVLGLERYSWNKVAVLTDRVYQEVGE